MLPRKNPNTTVDRKPDLFSMSPYDNVSKIQYEEV